MQPKHIKLCSVETVFSMPYVLQQILVFFDPMHLISSLQFLNKSAQASIFSQNNFLRWTLKQALSQIINTLQEVEDQAEVEESKTKDLSLVQIVQLFDRVRRSPPPAQFLGFRSSLGNEYDCEVYNLSIWRNQQPFCSLTPPPGVVTLIPSLNWRTPLILNSLMIQCLLYSQWHFVEKLRYGKLNRVTYIQKLTKMYKQKLGEVGLEKHLKGTVEQLQTFFQFNQYSFHQYRPQPLNSQKCSPSLLSLAQKNKTQEVVCYDFVKEFEAIQKHQFVLFRFTICTTSDCTQNLRGFVIVLHDKPLKVEETQMYRVVSKWKRVYQVKKSIDNQSVTLPPSYAFKETKTTSVQFFKQSYYRDHPEEDLRLLCLGECKERMGFFSFILPEVVSTRFISIICTSVHSEDTNIAQNVDIMKLIPYGAILPRI